MSLNQADENVRVLAGIMANREVLLLDFDGPICSVFAGYPASLIADQLRETLADESNVDLLPAAIEQTEDPFEVFKYAATIGNDEARYVEAALRAYEVEAIETATPTPSAHELILRWTGKGRSVAIVSNNSTQAIESYIYRHKLSKEIQISARESWNPLLLKPNPHLVKNCIEKVNAQPESCILVGDSVTDVAAAHAANVQAIGYANKPGKRAKLVEAGTNVVVESMATILRSIRA